MAHKSVRNSYSDERAEKFAMNAVTELQSRNTSEVSNLRGTRSAIIQQKSFDSSSLNLQNMIDNNHAILTNKEKFHLWYQKLLKAINHSIILIQAVMLRILFSLHSLIAIFYVFLVKQEEWYLVNVVGVVFLGIELFVTIIKRKGKEPRWFFPSFFIYICTMIPPIWFVELTRIDQANAKRKLNTTTYEVSFDIFKSISKETLGIEVDGIVSNAKSIQLENIAVGLEISLLLLVILGRWFSPKGNISRSHLSQLLLVYMSLASDIIDLLSLLNETQIQESSTMHYFTLSIFSWSLFQFCLNLVASRGRSFQSLTLVDPENEEITSDQTGSHPLRFSEQLNNLVSTTKNRINPVSKSRKDDSCWLYKTLRLDLLDSEIWSILITLIFQDGPFFVLRMTAVFRFDVRTFVTMFFTCKNAIILFLQFYRLSAIVQEARKKGKIDALSTNKADALTSLNVAASELDKFVMLSYAQNILLKNAQAKSRKNTNADPESSENLNTSNDPKNLFQVNPILLKSNLSNHHRYAIVLTSNFNINASCCTCDCHVED